MRWLFLPLALGACSSVQPEPQVITQDVYIPVAVSCVPPETPGEPEYSDTDEALLAADGPVERYRLLTIGREERRRRLRQVEPLIELCRENAE